MNQVDHLESKHVPNAFVVCKQRGYILHHVGQRNLKKSEIALY